MGISVLTFSIGTAIAKALLKVLLDDYKFIGELAPDVLDLLKDKAEQSASERTNQRSQALVAAQIAERMRPLFREARLPDNERAALVYELVLTLQQSQISADLLVSCNLDADTVARRLMAARPDAARDFSAGASELYRRALSEAANALITLADGLEGYTTTRDTATLTGLDELNNLIAEMLRRPDAAAETFEREYRRAIESALEKLELFGLPRLDEAARKQKLSVAYVTLQADRRTLREPDQHSDLRLLSALLAGDDEAGSGKDLASRRKEDQPLPYGPIDSILATGRRLIVRGDPGAGKSTLLQWIAITAATRQFAPPLTAWNVSVPFFIRLRALQTPGLPPPEEFPALIAKSVAGTMPPGWAHAQIRLGRAVVLIDGVDEVPQAQRPALLAALEGLVDAYPLARYIISSRPAAVSERDWPEWQAWAQRLEFAEATIQPLSRAGIDQLIAQWHDAYVEGCHTQEERSEALSLPANLKRLLDERAALRRLASSPLLCAMICALHLSRRKQLPVERIKLYEECVEMMLERRDKGREVKHGEEYPDLLYGQKLSLIRDFAYRMLRGGESDIGAEDAADAFATHQADRLGMGREVTGAKILKLFVERTGLLREVLPGRIDFAHRTFQEYLAARAIVHTGEISFLLKQIEDDQWHETILLAAGLANRQQAEKLLKGLLAGGSRVARRKSESEEAAAERRAKGQTLALACLETCDDISREMRQEIVAQAQALFPPSNTQVANAIAAAGDLAVPYLVASPLHTEAQAGLCVYTLGQIGSPAALAALVGYTHDERSQVILQLSSSWERFERREYRTHVIARMKELKLSTPLQQEDLVHLTTLTSLSLNGSAINDLVLLQTLTNLTELSLVGTAVNDLVPLQILTNLTKLTLDGPAVSDLVFLQALTGLTHLAFSNIRVIDFTPLQYLTNLTTLFFTNSRVSDLAPLQHLTNLTTLFLGGTAVSDFTHLQHLTNLKYLNLIGAAVSNFPLLQTLTNLTTLDLSYTAVSNLTLIQALINLTDLSLSHTAVSDLTPLQNLTRLTTLFLSNTAGDDLTPLSFCSELEYLDLEGSKVVSLEALRNCTKLKKLNIRNTKIQDLSPVAGHKDLEIVR